MDTGAVPGDSIPNLPSSSRLNSDFMAVKILQIPNDNRRAIIDDLQREIDLMKTLKHPNIVRYLGAEVDRSRNILHIFQEWAPGGSVSSLLRQFGGPFTTAVVRSYTSQILAGLQYLHSHGIIHRDIKVSPSTMHAYKLNNETRN